MTVQLLLAIWGAGLSTILALAKIIPEWPVVSVAPAQRPDDTPSSVTLVVFNPARRPLFIEGNWQFPRDLPMLRIFEQRALEGHREAARAIDERKHGFTMRLPRVFVPAQGTAYLTVSEVTEGTDRTIILRWHRNWLCRWLRFPVPVRVSSDLAAMMNRQ
jgi:hypothetical protein